MSFRNHLAVGAVLLLSSGAARAQAPEEASLADLSAEADLVFQGTVTDITYASSIEGIPHTFVTYRVEDVVKGNYREPTLTLRFIGGEKREGNVIRRLTVSHAPRFEMGEQALLMVRGNNQEQCPLSRCAQGRFRFRDGFVATEDGSLLGQDARGFRVLSHEPLSRATGDFGAHTVDPERFALATPLYPQEFVAHVRQLVRQQRTRSAPAAVQSADPSEPFEGPKPMVAGPPAERPAAPTALQRPAGASPQAERDRWEEEALRRNGGNPVLPVADR